MRTILFAALLVSIALPLSGCGDDAKAITGEDQNIVIDEPDDCVPADNLPCE